MRSPLASTGISRRALELVVAAIAAIAASAVVLAGVSEDVVEHNGSASTDPTHLRFFIDHRTPTIVALARRVTDLGGATLLLTLAVGVAVLLWYKGARVVLAVAPLVSLALGGAAASIGKQLVGRPRPSIGLRLVAESEPSFPSGHATDSTAFYVALALVVAIVLLRHPIARVATVAGGALTAGMVGLSRLVLGVHWPTDVIAGWALGLVTALVVTTVAAVAADSPPRAGLDGASRLRRAASRGHALATWHRGEPASTQGRDAGSLR